MTTTLKETLLEPSIYLPTQALITEARWMTDVIKLFKVELPAGMSMDHRPGQFVEVSLLGLGEAPIGITSSPSRSNGSFELCIRKAGDLTAHLVGLGPGDHIGVRGPFGRGFPYEKFRGKDLLFVLGGLGLPPARSLINEILDDRANYGRVIILYGAKQPGEFIFTDEVARWRDRGDVEILQSVDRPDERWKGHIGVVTTLFPQIEIYARNTVAVTIGPPVMFRFALMELLGKGIPEGNIWLSLERRMKCGVGKCGHCQVNHLYVCQSGPVFSYAELKHVEEAL